MEQIFVIDDDLDILDALKFVLEDASYTVRITQDGEDAKKLLTAKELPKLIILDVLLSGMDGRKICQKLKRSNHTKHIPIVMISARLAIEKSVYIAGADAFIPKPFDITVLLAKIRELLFSS